MIPAATALAQTAATPRLRAGFFYHPARRDHVEHAVRHRVDRWTPSGAGADFKLSPILAPLEAHKHYVTSFGEPREQGAAGLRAHDRAGHVALGRAPRPEGDGREDGADDRPDDRGEDRRRDGAAVARGRDPRRRRRARPAARARATTARRCRSATRRRRCRWSSTRARCSCSSSAPATRPRSAPSLAHRRASVLDMINDRSLELKRELGPADRARARRLSSRPCARRSGASRRHRSAILSGIDLPETPIGELPDFDAQVKLMFDLIAPRVSGERHARRVVHHGGRGHEPHLQPHRRAGCVPSRCRTTRTTRSASRSS